MNVAVTLFAAFMVTEQRGPLLESQPVQLETVQPDAAVAVRVTGVLWLNVADPVSTFPLTGAGSDDTVPFPTFTTVRVSSSMKFAVTLRAAVMVTVQGRTPVQPSPDQPVKIDPVDAAAVRVTGVP
jgi:hypothetical protein